MKQTLRRLLISVCVGFVGMLPAAAQNIEGQIIAAQYGDWRVGAVLQPATGNSFNFVANACTQQGGNKTFQAFQVGTPIEIYDADPSLNETVTPSAVSATNQGCSLTVAPAHTHNSFSLGSATGGLQESINANASGTAANTVVLTRAWFERGGSGSIIASVHGTTLLNLVDVTGAPYVWYHWNGSQYVVVPVGGGTLPSQQTLIGAKGDGNGVEVPEKGLTVSGTTGAVAWDEDAANGRFDCRNPKYAGGCLGSTPGLAMQAFANQLICYEAETGNHAQTLFPPGLIPVGTAGNPTLVMPSGAKYRGAGGGGYFGAGTVFQATYNNHTAVLFTAPTTPTSPCADGTTPTDSLTGGSRGAFSEHGCNQGGCVNVPGDSGSYPLGGPLQIGIDMEDGGGSEGVDGGVFSQNNGGDGTICGGLDSHCQELGGKANDYYFYFGIDTPGQNYQFSSQECHGDLDLSSGDGLFSGPFETYGTFMVPGAEYGSVGGICWGGGLTQLTNFFSQVGEIDVIHAGAGSNLSSISGGRMDLPEGSTFYDKSGGGTTVASNRTFGACAQDPAIDYFVHEVSVATPGSGQVPGTYTIVASSTGATIQVVVSGAGTVTAAPIVTIHGRGNPPTPVPTFTMPGGAVGSGVAATFTVIFQSYQWERHPGSGTTDIHCNVVWDESGGGNVYVGNQLTTATPGFGTTHPTADAFVFSTASWVANKGTLPNTKVSFDQPNSGAFWAGQAQTIWDADPTIAWGATNASGATINLDATGNRIFMGNNTPTTISSVTGSHMSADIEIYGDGFTTIPYTPLSTANGFGFDTCGKHPLLLQLNTLYHFTISGGSSGGSALRMSEFCDPPNDDWRQQNFFGLASPPTTDTLAANQTAGSEAVTNLPLLADGTISSAGSTSAFQYCFLHRAWVAGGTMVTHPVCTAKTPVNPVSGNNLFYHAVIPNDWTRYQVIFQSTTDSSYTASLGVILDVTAPTANPQPTIADIDFAVQATLTPTGAVVPSAWYGVKMTGTYNFDPTDIPGASSWPGNPGQVQIDSAGGFIYYCTAADTWKRAALTFSTF